MEKFSYNQQTSLFNCILPRENLSSKPHHHPASHFSADVDETKLLALKKLSEGTNSEIYFGKYLLDNESKCVLVKIIKTNSISSSR